MIHSKTEASDSMKYRMRIMLIALGLVFSGIFLYKTMMGMIMKHFMAQSAPVVTVSTMKVAYAPWQPKMKAAGSVRAIYGVNVTTSLAGLVQKIYMTPGALVQEGTILVQLNADAELGQLQALQAQAEIAKITYNRDLAQYAAHAVSKQTVDSDKYTWQSLLGQVAQQAAIVAKKTIRAPFTGRLGILLVSPGQYVNPGDTITSLQTYNPIYVDFYLPQQALAHLKVGQTVHVTTDAFRGKTYTGKVTTINSAVEASTRNVEVEATIANPKFELTPGMFVTAEVHTGNLTKYLTVPQTAISFNPYGDIVYIVHEEKQKKDKKPRYIAKQVFVTTGEERGDQITILSGIKAGDIIVTSGQIKLKNGSQVAVNNSIEPANNPAPVVQDE